MKTLNQIMQETQRIELLKSIFCLRLKNIRKNKGLSQSAVAKKLGCAVSTYANWEQGRRDPSIYDMFNLLYVLEIESNELFDLNVDEH